MSREATDLVMGLAAAEQAEYRAAHNKLPAASSPAAGRNSEGAVRKGSQAASSVPTGRGAESARALGHEAGNETSGQPSAMRADTSPRWAPVDSATGDLLDLLAIDDSLRADDWPFFLGVLKEAAAKNGGVIDQNHIRPRLHGEIRPARIGALYRRACREGLIRPNEGYTKTANSQSGNVGRPAKTYTWMGTAS